MSDYFTIADDLLKHAIAKVVDGRSMTQVEIARKLNTSQSKISRLLREMTDDNWLQSIYWINPEVKKSDEWRQMENAIFHRDELQRKIVQQTVVRYPELTRGGRRDLNRFRLEIAVVDLPQLTPESFGRAAAPIIHRLLEKVTRVGVGCGRTIEAVINALPPQATEKAPEYIIPIIGEPTHLDLMEHEPVHSSTTLAEQMRVHRHASPEKQRQPGLRGVYAYLPRHLHDIPIERVREDHPGYQRIFMGEKGRGLDQLEAVITGAGIVAVKNDARRGSLIRERLEQEQRGGKNRPEGIDAHRLNQLILGDLAGWLIAKPGLRPEDLDLVKKLNQGFVGMKDVDFMRVVHKVEPNQQANDRLPGVILLAFDDDKVDLAREAISLGLVSTLVTTKAFAEELGKPIKKPKAAKGKSTGSSQ